jgi:flagellar FliL protein
MAKQEPAPAPEESAAQPPKSKKKLIIIIGAVLLLLGGGAAAFFLMKPAHPAKPGAEAKSEADAKAPPAFVEIGTFTANLMHEDTDRYLQVGISLKVTNPELEEKIKAENPEIQNTINLLLQSKYPSPLSTVEGKERLASEIKEQVEYIMGLRNSAPPIRSVMPGTEPPYKAPTPAKKGIAAVLFTSFIIQ